MCIRDRVIDAGVNLLYTTAWYLPSILPAKACVDVPAPTTIYGCLCMNIDVIREETPLPLSLIHIYTMRSCRAG